MRLDEVVARAPERRNVHRHLPVRSILVVIDRQGRAHDVLARAVMLARHFDARLELFLCDAEPAYALRHLYDARGAEQAQGACLADARRYLESLAGAFVAQDVPLSIDAACESPLYEGIVRKVLRSSPDLVMKCVGGAGASEPGPPKRARLEANDWQLVRACPVPLLLVRGSPWQARPRIAAAVDVSGRESLELTRSILRAAQCIARGCAGDLDILYGEREPEMPPKAQRVLTGLARDFGVSDERVHVVHGEPLETLPRLAAEGAYDVLALGALSHRRALAAMVGTLTGRLLDTVDCDFLLVKSGAFS